MTEKIEVAAKPSAWISRLKFSGGDEFEFLPTHKVLIVGANNSGKSKTLDEMYEWCSKGREADQVVLKELKLEKTGLLRVFLDKDAQIVGDAYRLGDWQVHRSNVQFWEGPHYLINGLAGGFIRKISAKDRLSICDQQNSIGPNDAASKPQHVLYQSDSLMISISAHFKRAFGSDLMFDYRGGSRLPIHVGNIPDGPGFKDRVSDAYTAAVRSQPLLDKQGDGIRSYAGILFETIVSGRDINFVDEPEAFLHPPQMQKLGETLAQHVSGQLFVATHSSDVLRGFLEGKKGDVRILRIRREDGVNKVFEAPQDAIKELWEKPVLRYSNALEGIFHEQTILCEDHSDCRLFNSSADYLRGKADSPWKDTAYVPTGGKDAVKKVASVLRKIGVPVKVIFDFDFLSSSATVRETIEAFGGSWDDVRDLWRRLDAAVRSGVKAKSVMEIKEGIKSIIDKAEPEKLPKSDITEEMKQTSPWSVVKKTGKLGLPRGEAQDTFSELQSKLEGIGIYLVPVGEIENFCPNIGNHGPAFVTNLLSEVAMSDERLSHLHKFVEHVHMGAHARLEGVGPLRPTERDGGHPDLESAR